jgi:hypothetical protein
MKKILIFIGIILTILLMVNNVTAVQTINGNTILKNEKKVEISKYRMINQRLYKLNQLKGICKIMNSKENDISPFGLLSGFLFIMIGLLGISVSGMLAFFSLMSAKFGVSDFAIPFLIFSAIVGLTSLTFLVGGTVLLFI